jgi:hypothetical protein
MYEAKQNGKNRWTTYRQASPLTKANSAAA